MSMDIGALYNNYVGNAADSAVTARAEELTKKNYEGVADKELMDACKQFEAYFVEQMFKEMQKTVNTDSEMSAPSKNLTSYMKDSLTQEYAKSAVETEGFGLAQALYDQMKRTEGPSV